MLKVSTKSLYKLDGLDGNQSKKYIDNHGAFHKYENRYVIFIDNSIVLFYFENIGWNK